MIRGIVMEIGKVNDLFTIADLITFIISSFIQYNHVIIIINNI